MKQSLIQWVNNKLCDIYQGAKIYGVAKQAKRGTEILPVTFVEGKEYYIGITDKDALRIYHKELSTTTTQDLKSSYGDGTWTEVNTHQMALIIFFDERRLGVDADQLYMLIQRRISGVLKLTGARLVRVTVNSLNMDDARIYSQEYQSDTFRLTVGQRLIQVNYTLQVSFDKKCIPNCI